MDNAHATVHEESPLDCHDNIEDIVNHQNEPNSQNASGDVAYRDLAEFRSAINDNSTSKRLYMQ